MNKQTNLQKKNQFLPQFPLFEAIKKGTLFKNVYEPYNRKRRDDG